MVRCELSRPPTPFWVWSFLSRPLWLSSTFWDGTKKPRLGHHRSPFVGKKLRDHSESDRRVARCELSRTPTPVWVRSFLFKPLCLSLAFWDRIKKPSLGHHRSAFVGTKLWDDSELDHPVVRCELSRPLTPFYNFILLFIFYNFFKNIHWNWKIKTLIYLSTLIF